LRDNYDINAPLAGPGNVQAKRPYPDFSTITAYHSKSHSLYNSLVLKTQKRFSDGLAFLASYTWGKLLATGGIQHPGDLGSAPLRDPRNLEAEWGRDYFDVRQRFVASFMWQLPVGPGQRFGSDWSGALEQILAGWQVNGILTLQSGFPITPQLSFDNSNTGRLSDRPDVVGDPNDGPQTPDLWFNTAAFVLPERFSYGNAGKNIIEGPGTKQLDLSVFKQFKAKDVSVQLRFEFFNITNVTNFNQPNTTFGSPSFGVISSAGPARQTQFGVRLSF
jgi:hypothetical protein